MARNTRYTQDEVKKVAVDFSYCAAYLLSTMKLSPSEVPKFLECAYELFLLDPDYVRFIERDKKHREDMKHLLEIKPDIGGLNAERRKN